MKMESGLNPFAKSFDALGYGRASSRFRSARAIGILDEFSESCFSPEFDYYPAGMADTDLLLSRIEPDLVFVESAWSGNWGSWRYQLTSPTGPKPAVIDFFRKANDYGVPSVFWNKEDPPHFEQFLPVARLADRIYTTEVSLVPKYRELTGNKNVEVMQFAAQPEIHRPAQVTAHRRGDVCFAGQYFQSKFPERSEQMQILFKAAQDFDFSIFSRVHGGDATYQFPAEYKRFIKGSLPYHQMVREYRRHKIFLNVNSVPNSESMCARRVFELAASKTFVVSTETPAIRNVYADDEVALVSTVSEAKDAMRYYLTNDRARQRAVHRALGRTMRSHTYAQRAIQVLTDLGLDVGRRRPKLDVLIEMGKHSDIQGTKTVENSGIADSLARVYELGILGNIIGDPEVLRGAIKPELFALVRTSTDDATNLLATVQLGNSYGPGYLEDLYYVAEQVPEAEIIAKPRLSSGRFTEADFDLWGTRTQAGAFLVRNHSLLDRAQALVHAQDYSVGESVYISDPFNFRYGSDAGIPAGLEV